jgi:hypothetical protein
LPLARPENCESSASSLTSKSDVNERLGTSAGALNLVTADCEWAKKTDCSASISFTSADFAKSAAPLLLAHAPHCAPQRMMVQKEARRGVTLKALECARLIAYMPAVSRGFRQWSKK